MADSSDLDTQMNRFNQVSRTPRYDADVCGAATRLRDHARTAAALASRDCDPSQIASSLGQLRESAESEIALFCTREPVASGQQTTATRDFIFPDSDRRLLQPSELSRLSATELRIARNEIYARRGRFFQSDDLRQHFGSFAWYRPNSWNPSLNAVEQQNVQMILNAEQHR
ncbi:MAG: YARHG domain-containing protein [Xanthobacteraceae bacterium]